MDVRELLDILFNWIAFLPNLIFLLGMQIVYIDHSLHIFLVLGNFSYKVSIHIWVLSGNVSPMRFRIRESIFADPNHQFVCSIFFDLSLQGESVPELIDELLGVFRRLNNLEKIFARRYLIKLLRRIALKRWSNCPKLIALLATECRSEWLARSDGRFIGILSATGKL